MGVLLNPDLSWVSQMAATSSGFNQLRFIAQLQAYLGKEAPRMLVNVLVVSKIDYCNALHMGFPLETDLRIAAGFGVHPSVFTILSNFPIYPGNLQIFRRA